MKSIRAILTSLVLVTPLAIHPLVYSEEMLQKEVPFPIEYRIADKNDLPRIVIRDVFAPVKIVRTESDLVQVDVGGEELKNLISVSRKDNLITIAGKKDGGENSITVTSTSGKVDISVSGNNKQRIVVNDKVITDIKDDNPQATEPQEVIIRLPDGMNVLLDNLRHLNATVPLGDVEFLTKGSYRAQFKHVEHLDIQSISRGSGRITIGELRAGKIEISGATRVNIDRYLGGDLEASLGGASKLTAKEGTYAAVSLRLTGAAKVETHGTITGGMDVQAGGAARFQHSGKVAGKVVKNRSGAARILITE